MASNEMKIPNDITIGMIGCGKMGEAILNGLIDSNAVSATQVSASRRRVEHLSSLKSKGVYCTSNNKDVARRAKILIIAVKAYMFPDIIKEIIEEITNEKVIVSIAAGLRIKKMEAMLPQKSKFIRVMPNTPCLVQAGATCYSRGTYATESDGNVIKNLFSTIGICEEVPEKLINGIIGVAGSAVAYMFMGIGAMADGGVKMGLSREMSQRFSAQAMMGAAKMALESDLHTETLKDNVCSPGGTTIAAVHKLEQLGYRNALFSAVETATATANKHDEND